MKFDKEILFLVMIAVQSAALLLAGISAFDYMIETSIAFPPEAGLPGFYLQYEKVTHTQIMLLVIVVVLSAIVLVAALVALLRGLRVIKQLNYNNVRIIKITLTLFILAFSFFYAFITPVDIKDIPYNFVASDGSLAEVAFWQLHIYLFYSLVIVAFVYGAMMGWSLFAVRKWLIFLSGGAGISAVFYGFTYHNMALIWLGCTALFLSVMGIRIEKRFS